MDDDRLATTILEIVQAILDQPRRFRAAARLRGITVAQLTTAAILEAVRRQAEAPERQPPPSPTRDEPFPLPGPAPARPKTNRRSPLDSRRRPPGRP